MGNNNEKQQKQQEPSQSVLQINGTKSSIQTALQSAKSNSILFISLESQKSLQKPMKISILDKQNPSQQTSESIGLAEIIQRIASLGKNLYKVIVQSPEPIEKQSLQDILLSLRDNNKNITDLSICLESSPFCYQDFLEITESIKKFENITHLKLKMVNKCIDLNPLFFRTYMQTVLPFQNLQSLDILFSFRKLGVYRQEFQEFLKNLQSFNNLSKIYFAIENSCYTDICLESFVMLAALPKLEDLFITTYEFLRKDEKDDIVSSNIFESINESHLNKLNQSLLKKVVLKQLNSLDASTIFVLLKRLPSINTIELSFNSKNSNLFDSSRQLLPPYVDPQPSQTKPILESLTIEILNKQKLIFFKDILYGLMAFKSYYLSFQFMQSQDYLFQRQGQVGVTDIELEKTLLSIVYDKLDFNADHNKTFNFSCIKQYMKHKDTVILSIMEFDNRIAPLMICNPQYVKFDLYFD